MHMAFLHFLQGIYHDHLILLWEIKTSGSFFFYPHMTDEIDVQGHMLGAGKVRARLIPLIHSLCLIHRGSQRGAIDISWGWGAVSNSSLC